MNLGYNWAGRWANR